jgi:hypothetical protein
MVNPGAFQGMCRTFLIEQKPLFSAAVSGNYAADCLADIQCRYFKCYPVDLDHDTEPSPEHLSAVDDNVADPEPQITDPDSIPEDEYLQIKNDFDARRKIIEFQREVRNVSHLIMCTVKLTCDCLLMIRSLFYSRSRGGCPTSTPKTVPFQPESLVRKTHMPSSSPTFLAPQPQNPGSLTYSTFGLPRIKTFSHQRCKPWSRHSNPCISNLLDFTPKLRRPSLISCQKIRGLSGRKR